jgi:hypothetical protein
MNFIANLLTFFTFAVIILLGLWQTAGGKLKAEMKENYDLEDENYNLKKIIDDLKEENKSLKEMVMEFKGGELTKGALIKGVQELVDKEEIERLEKLRKINQEYNDLFIPGKEGMESLKEEDKKGG